MSEVVGVVGISHSPFATLLDAPAAGAPGAAFLADAEQVRAAVAGLAPDVAVVVGPDHFHGNFYDVMPPFVLGVEQAVAFGDFGSRSGPLPVARDLAWAVHAGLTDADVDVALSYDLTVDHGIVQSYEMLLGGTGVPLVPLVLNTAAPPLPTPARCLAVGAALGRALRAAAGGRVLVVASGGLSHWLPSNDPRDPTVAGEKRDSLIHGRRDPVAFSAVREPRVRAMAGNPDSPVNPGWDRWFLDRIAEGDLDAVAALGHDGIEDAAGSGGQEIRTWLLALAAVGAPTVWSSYEPVPEWITGMGIATSFPVAGAAAGAGPIATEATAGR